MDLEVGLNDLKTGKEDCDSISISYKRIC
jgi:hypothetical protein